MPDGQGVTAKVGVEGAIAVEFGDAKLERAGATSPGDDDLAFIAGLDRDAVADPCAVEGARKAVQKSPVGGRVAGRAIGGGGAEQTEVSAVGIVTAVSRPEPGNTVVAATLTDQHDATVDALQGRVRQDFIKRCGDLLALDLAEAQASASEVDVDASLQKLAGSVEFWQRVRAQPQDLFTVLFSGALIERAYWIANAWLDRAGQEQITRHGLLLDRVLKPASGPVQWQRAVADQYLLFRNGMADLDPGLGTVLWRCVTDSASEGCLESLTTSASFAPQATFNLQAINCEQILRVLEASPRDHEEVAADAGRIMQGLFPQFDDVGALLSQLSYNFTGRVLASIGTPSFDWSKREHDREALRRMIVLKRMALESGVPAESLASVMALQDSTLGNPLTGNPFDWDATSRILYFEPSAKQDWKRERVEIAYRR